MGEFRNKSQSYQVTPGGTIAKEESNRSMGSLQSGAWLEPNSLLRCF
jgi:hypothetical protein